MKKVYKVLGLIAIIALASLSLAGCKFSLGDEFVHCPECGNNAKLEQSAGSAYLYKCQNAACGITFAVAKQ